MKNPDIMRNRKSQNKYLDRIRNRVCVRCSNNAKSGIFCEECRKKLRERKTPKKFAKRVDGRKRATSDVQTTAKSYVCKKREEKMIGTHSGG